MKVGIILGILALTPGVCQAVIVDYFYTDGTIQDGDVYDIVHVMNNATVDVLGGRVSQLHANDSSTVNFYAGLVGYVGIENTGVFNLQGTLSSLVSMSHSGTFNINQGMFEGRILGSWGQITVSDGTVDIADSYMSNDTIMDIYGGVVTFDQMLFNRYAVLNVYGGEVTFKRSSLGYAFGLSGTAAFNVYYADIIYEGGGGEITGYRLRDGNLFMLDQFTQEEIDLITFVPEPATFVMLALGGILLRRRK
jgi:hypothetical protein